jgi:hypothetical protein
VQEPVQLSGRALVLMGREHDRIMSRGSPMPELEYSKSTRRWRATSPPQARGHAGPIRPRLKDRHKQRRLRGRRPRATQEATTGANDHQRSATSPKRSTTSIDARPGPGRTATICWRSGADHNKHREDGMAAIAAR